MPESFEPRPRPPAGITSRLVLDFFAYWERIRARRTAPSWADVNPAAIKHLLPYLLVGEVQHEPFDLRYRLVGYWKLSSHLSEITV
jgi:hypothetical protein